jgi:hypothetical protein
MMMEKNLHKTVTNFPEYIFEIPAVGLFWIKKLK